MRVVHVMGALLAGGAERFVSELVVSLAEAGVETSLLLLSRRRDRAGEAMAAQLDRHGVSHMHGPTVPVRVRSVLWYARALGSLRPEIVHLHNLNAEMAHLLALPALRFPYLAVRTIHSTELRAPLLARLGFRWNPVHATVFCSASAHQKNAGMFSNLCRVIPNGVRFAGPPRDPQREANAMERLELAPEARHFLCVGRMDGETPASAPKAHDVLLRAWAASRLSTSGALLHLLGDGNLRPALVAQAGGDPSVLFHGVRSDIEDWMLAADCLVMPSRFEGMPLAALEAIGAGLPCIFSGIPSLRELAPPAARWCPPDDVQSLTRALQEEAREGRPPAVEAVETFRERFSIETSADRHRELYQQLQGGSSRASAPGSRAAARD